MPTVTNTVSVTGWKMWVGAQLFRARNQGHSEWGHQAVWASLGSWNTRKVGSPTGSTEQVPSCTTHTKISHPHQKKKHLGEEGNKEFIKVVTYRKCRSQFGELITGHEGRNGAALSPCSKHTPHPSRRGPWGWQQRPLQHPQAHGPQCTAHLAHPAPMGAGRPQQVDRSTAAK